MSALNLLKQIEGPDDIKRLPGSEIKSLCEEIRSFLIMNISHTGGHLAANLGVVELTVALLRCFDFPRDRIVWDVGHQSYVYKILTGRRERFHTLRAHGGLCGFPRPSESEYDSFATGHSSTSISAALGMDEAHALRGEDSYTVAVIGDGALTGGLAYEGLNNAGKYGKKLIIILNDNEHSISKNVGSVADYLATFTSRPRYFRFKDHVKRAVTAVPLVGKPLYRSVHHVKTIFKRTFSRGNFFEQLGFAYYGPVDGHDEQMLEHLLERAKGKGKPVVIHVKTKKGKGYRYAENSPEAFHGISRFDIGSGEPVAGNQQSFSAVFGETVCSLAEQDERVCAITAAMTDGVGLAQFAERYPERFFDVGIAEQHALTFAAGLAISGMRPFAAIYSSFLQRGYDQTLHDICLQQLPVTICVDRAGLVGEDGDTHQGVFDVSMLAAMPGMQIDSPATFRELRLCLRRRVQTDGPAAVRYPRGGERTLPESAQGEPVYTGDEEPEVLFVTYGRIAAECLAAAGRMRRSGKRCGVLRYIQIKPLELEAALPLLPKAEKVFFVEEGIRTGGIGEQFALALLERGITPEYRILAIDEQFVQHGTVPELFADLGLDADHIYQMGMGETE